MEIFVIVAVIVTVYLVSSFVKEKLERFQTPHPVIQSLKRKLRPVYPDIDDLLILEGKESYSLNKNKVYICLKDKKTGELYDHNMLTYVLLHELAHVMNKDDVGHTPKFHEKFDELLDKAESLGLYDSSLPLIQDYCK
jgi:hypothetical protein